MDEPARPANTLPPDVATLAEILLERLNAAAGRWHVELYAEDGRLRTWRREEEGGRTQLERFDTPDM